MVGTHKESFFQSLSTMGRNAEAAKANGVEFGTESSSSESRGDGMLTYKRRRNSKASENGKVSDDSVSQPCEKSESLAPKTLIDDFSLRCQRNIILAHISQSLDGEGGLKSCIKNEFVSHLVNGNGTSVKESVDESKHHTITELCERTFSDIIMSEKFTQLCSLLLEHFQGFKADKLFNLNHVSTRMKESAYESKPSLFESDIQEIWTKLQNIGSDITALAKCLSDKTTSSFCEQFPTQEFEMHAKPEQAEAHAPDGAHTCRHCWLNADVNNGLVCDSCEGMFHISCIDPPVKEIPTRSWYCANCTAKEIEPSHENCVACKRLVNTTSREEESLPDETIEELEESSNDLLFSKDGSENINTSYCKVCRTEVIIGDEDYRICGHSFCPHKFYHERCLTKKQLTSHGPCWYCPSCLCGGCLADRDDDKIVLCDGCDHAYHIYCMHPPRDEVPEGKWFCEECESGLARIREARRIYGIKMQGQQGVSRKRESNSRVKGKKGLDKSGGVDMLLNAAKTLNYEENLAFIGLKTN